MNCSTLNASFFSKLNAKQSIIIAVPVIVAVLCYQIYLQNNPKIQAISLSSTEISVINPSEEPPVSEVSVNALKVNEANYETEIVANVDAKTVDPLLKKTPHSILNKFKYTKEMNNKDVQKFMKEYKVSNKTLPHRTKDANPHFRYIVDQLEKKKMPLELALLPVVESNYKPNAVSCKGAAGIWQIMPKTGKSLGLKRKGSYDGRKDIKASTKAALNYLEYLHEKFNNDWMLALAAYNAGEGTVSKAIKKNIKHGKPTSFWHLKLPTETKNYVPKFIAIARVAKAI
jgi:hypothetical protein